MTFFTYEEPFTTAHQLSQRREMCHRLSNLRTSWLSEKSRRKSPDLPQLLSNQGIRRLDNLRYKIDVSYTQRHNRKRSTVMKKSRTRLFSSSILIYIVILSLATGSAVYAQAITGRIVGTVQDRNQSAVPNAKVTITNQGTGISSNFQTDDRGNYIAPSLPSGEYKVTVAASGFRQAVASNIVVNVAQTTRLDFTLEVGNVQDAVEITGGASIVQSTTSDLGEIVNQRQIQTLPLNGRIFSQLIQLVPGAVPAGFRAEPEAASTAGARSQVSASVNGLPWSGTI